MSLETFDSLDNWTEISTGGASIVSGRLQQERTNDYGSSIMVANDTLPAGDFDISIDWDLDAYWASDMWFSRLYVQVGSERAGVGIGYNSSTSSLQYLTWDRNGLCFSQDTAVSSGKVRLVRVGDDVTAYYDEGSGWVALDYPIYTGSSEAYVAIQTYGWTGGTVRMLWDNLSGAPAVASNDLYCPDSEVEFIGPAATMGQGFGVPDCADIPDFFALTEWNALACWDTADVPNFVAVSDPVTRILAPDCADVPRFFATTGRTASFRVPDSASVPRFRGSTGKAASFSAPDCADVPRHYALVNGFATILLPDSEVIPIFSVWGTRYVVVMNALHHGVTEYDDFPFESLVEFEGSCYGLTGSGWYILGGDTDDGAEIAASFATGDMNYNNGEEMRLLDAKLTARSAEQVKLTVAYDDETGYDYYEGGDPSGEVKSIRFVPGKGAKGRAVRLTIENTNGGRLEAKQLIMTVADLSRGGR